LCLASTCFLFRRAPPIAHLFPYTTLFRSHRGVHRILILALFLNGPLAVRARGGLFTPFAAGGSPAPPFRRMGLVMAAPANPRRRSEEHTSELQSHLNLVCRLLLVKKKT